MNNPEVLKFLQTRQSQRHFKEPAPSQAVLNEAFKAAVRAPDHGYLRPWRYVIFQDDARADFGEVLAQIRRAEGGSEADIIKARGWFMRAPMVIAAIAHIQERPKIPSTDQEYAVAASVMAFQLALNAQGFDAMWRTGWLVEHEVVRSALKLEYNEKIIGFVYTGLGAKDNTEVKPLDTSVFVSQWRA